MKRILLLYFFCLAQIIFAQKEANIWYFGHQAGIDFNSGEAVVLTDAPVAPIAFSGSGASICSPTGELLFFTSGANVYNKNREPMLNGIDIGGGVDSTQPAIIIPKPGNRNIYYIFTTYYHPLSDGVRYTEVDMSMDGGLGAVTINKGKLLTPNMNNKLTAIKSTSFNGYWILAHKWNSNKFIVYKVTSDGINQYPDEYSIGSTISGNIGNAEGQLKLSPDGKKLAMASAGDMNQLELFDFNPSTGEISNPIVLIDESASTSIYGVEFSPSGDLLYVSGIRNGVYQYNLKAGSIPQIKESKTILKNSFFENFASLQLAPDGRIYVAKDGHQHLDFIEKPDNVGVSCSYSTYHSIYTPNGGLYLEKKRSTKGFPQFIQSFFYVGFSAENFCLNDTTQFTANISQDYDSIFWDFGDGNTSIEENPQYTFNQPGIYSVTLTVISGTKTSVENKEIIIYKNPIVTQAPNLSICDDDNDGFSEFNLSAQTSIILGSQNTSIFQVDYFASLTDYENGNKITNYAQYINKTSFQEQTIIARVINKKNPDCEITTSFKIKVFESPKPKEATHVSNVSHCDNISAGTDNDGKVIFNLKEKETEILNGQSSENFKVSYYKDEDLSQVINNPDNYVNNQTIERIYVKVENKLYSDCFSVTSFLIEVYSLPTINSLVYLKQCDNSDINGFSIINLNEAKNKIVLNPDNYKITFFEDKQSAEDNKNPITSPSSYTNQIVSNDVVWARVENSKGCFKTGQVNLIISTTKIPTNFLKSFYKCDDGDSTTDGVSNFNFSTVTQEIRNLFPINQRLVIKYYRNENDALSELNEISDISNYKNSGYPYQQKIYIRVDSELNNDCLGLGHHITLNVEKVPTFNQVTIAPQCDNDGDGLYSFDTSRIQDLIIGNQSNIDVFYFDENNVKLPSPLPNPFITKSQNINVRVVNSNSQNAEGKCYDEGIIKFIVNNVPYVNAVNRQEQCDQDFDGITLFNTENIEKNIIGNQVGMVVKYYDENNTLLSSPLPNPFNTKTQRIRVRVENPQYATCFAETTIDFVVKEKPSFELDNETIICTNTSSTSEIKVKNPTGNFSYIWKDSNGNIISESMEAFVKKGGEYYVTAISEFGCTSDTKSILVHESSIANITNENIEITGDSNNHSIIINTKQIGKGSYEFSLMDSNSNTIYYYQESPVFDNLKGGNYTINIRDTYGCGIQSVSVAIISYPKFFTPNNDGVNDTWHISGIGNSIYKKGRVKIYDRFGKLITILGIEDKGWDGFYKGAKLPSSDYWFQASFIDFSGKTINKKGNFSLLRR